jgi:t-SNARE complex subunit (syntaxin)
MQCDGEQIPRTCAEAFGRIERTLGELVAMTADARNHAARTNGHVGRLFERVDDHATRLATLEARRRDRADEDDRASRSKTLEILGIVAGVVVVLAGVIAVLARAG